MPINFNHLIKNATVEVSHNDEGINLKINTTRLTIRSVSESDIDYYQCL